MAKRTNGYKGSQVGTPNTKGIAKRTKARRIIPPWGLPVPVRIKSAISRVSGSSTRQAKPAPEERGMQYPKNQPSQWPIVPDYVNHTRVPSLSGVNTTTAAAHNAAVEHAYTRAKYQSSP